jgi:hypothetical protein
MQQRDFSIWELWMDRLAAQPSNPQEFAERARYDTWHPGPHSDCVEEM